MEMMLNELRFKVYTKLSSSFQSKITNRLSSAIRKIDEFAIHSDRVHDEIYFKSPCHSIERRLLYRKLKTYKF